MTDAAPAPPVKAHRGVLLLIFGILSIVCCVFFGIASWVMANGDLKAMAEGRMDRSGEGLTKAGKITGIIGVVLALLWVLWAVAFGGMAVLAGRSALKAAAQVPAAAPAELAKAVPAPASPAEAPSAANTQVSLETLLGDYKANEVRADAAYKGKIIQITGIVGDVKKDLMDDIYITLGTGAQFEIPEAQCFFDKSHTQAAAAVDKGTRITIRGRVSGLMMNVLLKDCELVP